MVIGSCAVLSACNKDPNGDTCEHVNEDRDGKCDKCGETIKHKHEEDDDGMCKVCGKDMSEEEEVIEYPWSDDDPVRLIFQFTLNDESAQNPSGCERYLAGEDPNNFEEIDDMVADRNSEAEYATNIDPEYLYWPNTDAYDWGQCDDKILEIVDSGSTNDVPDVYCNFTYDMVSASLKGAFANLKSTKYENGNYFEFNDADYNEAEDNRGYMNEYMESTTLSLDKTYILASDYFIDLIRSFFIVPVNIQLLESIEDPALAIDRDGDGSFTINDFYEEVKEKKWTYSRVADYAAAIYQDTGGATDEDIEDTLGFAIGAGGVASSGIVYSTDIKIVNKDWSDSLGDYVYDYPDDCPDLYTLFNNLSDLVNKTGVVVIMSSTEPNMTKYGTTSHQAVRARFCENKVLFGSVVVVGSLEFPEYQTLKGAGGFGVVPVPLYHDDLKEGETYLTSIHNNARPGAIARNTRHYSECTAFLNYQSTHSTHILNEYYDVKLQYQIANNEDMSITKGTVYMLQYIRTNVRSAFDKTFEDAVGVFFASDQDRWHHIMSTTAYDYKEISNDYKRLVGTKKDRIKTLYAEFKKLPE